MDYNAIAADILQELKDYAKQTDENIAERLGISRQEFARRRDTNSLTTEDITTLSVWLVEAFDGGFYIDRYAFWYGL